MTVVTALAVSGNPLTNSKANANSRAIVKATCCGAGRATTDSQKDIGNPWEERIAGRVRRLLAEYFARSPPRPDESVAISTYLHRWHYHYCGCLIAERLGCLW